MKLRVVSLSLLVLCLTLPAIPTMASNTLYDNSSANNAGAWTDNITGATTPEPNSIMLFGPGIIGLVAVLRRKRFEGDR
jgi:hypothetical protein